MRERQRIHNQVQRYRKQRGAVAVFLTIILVPCIVVACLFVDVSRVQYSKMEAVSAADLALDGLMANYDALLQDYYGFVASSQNIEQFLDKSEEYFKGIMRAEGNGEGSELFSAYINSLRSGQIADFLKTDIIGEVNIDTVGNGSLGTNAALIEDGIVEFMKYRGLPRIGSRALDITSRVLNWDFALDDLENSDNDQPAAEAKKAYGEAESKLLEDAFHTYLAIRNYEEGRKNNSDKERGEIPSEAYYNNVSNDIALLRKDLGKVTDLITKFYAETDGIEEIFFPEYNIADYEWNRQIALNQRDYVATKVIDGSTTYYYLHKTEFDNLVLELGDSLTNTLGLMDQAAGNIVSTCEAQGLQNYTANGGGSTPSTGTNPAIYCRRVQSAVSQDDLNTIDTKGEEILTLYAKVQAALSCVEDPNDTANPLPADWEQQLTNLSSRIITYYNKYLTFSNINNTYKTIRENYVHYANAHQTVEKTKNRTWTIESEFGSQKTLNEFASIATGKINKWKEDLTNCINQLNVAIDGGPFKFNSDDYTAVSLDTLVSEADNKATKLDEWESALGDSEYAEKVDRPEIDRIKANLSSEEAESVDQDDLDAMSEDMSRRIDGERVRELKERLTNIRKDLQDCLDKVDQLTYGGNALSTLGSAESYITAGRTVIPASDLDLSLDQNAVAAAEYAQTLIAPSESELYKFRGIVPGKNGNNPDLETDTPELYKYLKDQFGKNTYEISKKTKEAKNKLSDFQKQADEAITLITEMDPTAKNEKGASISNCRSSVTWNLFSAIAGVVSSIKDITEGDGGAVAGNVRDKIYFAEYVMDMCSYSSFNNEGRYRFANSKGQAVTIKDYDNNYNVTDWGKSDAVKIKEDQSLTNKPITAEYNKQFLGEAEYILFGKGSLEECNASMYKSIFAIREALNVTSGFLLFWNPAKNATALLIEELAHAVALGTMGIVPAILVKTVVILGLATLEACTDLTYLKKGVPVTVYKTKDSQWKWALSYKGDGDVSGSSLKEDAETSAPEDENGLYYSDYLYFFMLMAMSDPACYKAMLLRMGDIVEANMQIQKNDFDLNKSYCYFRLTAGMQVKPLALDIPLVDSYDGADIHEFKKNSVWCRYDLNVSKGYS